MDVSRDVEEHMGGAGGGPPPDAAGWADAVGARHGRADAGARIVCLVPSITELLFDLGVGDRLVGRTGFCIHPRDRVRALPKLGGTKDVKLDALRGLAPTHVIVNIDENRRDTVEDISRFVPNVIVTHPCAPEDNLALYALLGGIFDCEAAATSLSVSLQTALAEAAELRAALVPERVLYLIWREPWMTVSSATYIAAMLAAVGWESMPRAPEPRYPVVDWEDASMADVARVFLSSEPYRFGPAHVGEVGALASRPAMLIDGEMCSWYGSRAIAGVRYLTALRRRLAKG
ncbi:helical backbone metal receptor [Azoarcus olearius]|uniref:Conserved hypothetical periplasmic binding protein n=1 Tax=Azoarcus sp. (strain BH72) TaxID=418699 RepID=A1K2E9_AZOSB|nr:helical backbone metal receptor [Azoarcus olearius]CAL93004.1 conserved hypothetical periplasmic binding protein [Azoarcus olearius]